jgi:hypothetical protein
VPRSFTDEAIVLRSHNVGETDRFCVLLTRTHGRIMVRATGARKLQSRRGRGLLPMHRINVTWEQHSFGQSVTATESLDSHSAAWSDPQRFSCAAQGLEILLSLTEDGLELTDVYDLTAEFLRGCCTTVPTTALRLYTMKLLKLLGYLPSPQSAPMHLSPAFIALLDTLDDIRITDATVLGADLSTEIGRFLQGLLGSQLGVSLKSPGVRLSMSSGVTPICQ